MLDVPMMLGSASFQSNDVSGAHVSWLRFYHTTHIKYKR